jgi:hypothetical protein
MAGDWIKVQLCTPDKPEVHQMADMLEIDPDAVTGKLLRIWIWADQQTVDGNAQSVTKSLLDRITSTAGFADSMLRVGWLEPIDGGFCFPNFSRHNGNTAKTRAASSKRVEKHRKTAKAVGENCNADTVTTPLPEKRREEKTKTIYTPGSDVRIPDSINDPNVKAAVGIWLDYLDRKHPEKSIEINSPEEEALYRTIQTWGVSVGQICVRIDECISNSWANLRRPEGKSSTTATASIWPEIVAHLGRIDPYKDYSEGIAAKFGNKALAAVKSIGVPNINQANEYQASVLAKRFGELMNADV